FEEGAPSDGGVPEAGLRKIGRQIMIFLAPPYRDYGNYRPSWMLCSWDLGYTRNLHPRSRTSSNFFHFFSAMPSAARRSPKKNLIFTVIFDAPESESYRF